MVVSHCQVQRTEELLRCLLVDGGARLIDRYQVVLFTDGDNRYADLFLEYFGQPYRPSCQPARGRPQGLRSRIPRTAAHVQIVKHHQGDRLQEVEIRYTHGIQKRIRQALVELGYRVPNTSCIEQRNVTARLMSGCQGRIKMSPFSRVKKSPERGLAVRCLSWHRHLLFLGRHGLGLCQDPRLVLFFEPITVAFDIQRRRVMQQPIQDGRGQDMVVEDLAPIQETLVAGDDQAGPLVAPHHQAEEQAGFLAGERQVADLVDDQHFGISQLLQAALQAVFVLGIAANRCEYPVILNRVILSKMKAFSLGLCGWVSIEAII